MRNIPHSFLHRFLLVMGLVLMLPVFAATDSLLDALAVSIPGLDWIQGHGTISVPWISVPAYLLLVAAYSVAAIALTGTFLRYYAGPAAAGRRSWRPFVVGVSFCLALVTVLRGWLFFDDRDAVTIAGAAASAAALIGIFVISVCFHADGFARQNVRAWQFGSITGVLVIAWAAGLVWFLA